MPEHGDIACYGPAKGHGQSLYLPGISTSVSGKVRYCTRVGVMSKPPVATRFGGQSKTVEQFAELAQRLRRTWGSESSFSSKEA